MIEFENGRMVSSLVFVDLNGWFVWYWFISVIGLLKCSMIFCWVFGMIWIVFVMMNSVVMVRMLNRMGLCMKCLISRFIGWFWWWVWWVVVWVCVREGMVLCWGFWWWFCWFLIGCVLLFYNICGGGLFWGLVYIGYRFGWMC